MLKIVARLVTALAALGAVSWVAGLLAYAIALRAFFGETASTGDWTAVVYWSGFLYVPFVLLLVWPLILRLSDRYGGARRFVMFPIAGVAAGVVPTILVGAVWGARGIINPEAMLFCILFGAAGGTFALGYATAFNWIHQ